MNAIATRVSQPRIQPVLFFDRCEKVEGFTLSDHAVMDVYGPATVRIENLAFETTDARLVIAHEKDMRAELNHPTLRRYWAEPLDILPKVLIPGTEQLDFDKRTTVQIIGRKANTYAEDALHTVFYKTDPRNVLLYERDGAGWRPLAKTGNIGVLELVIQPGGMLLINPDYEIISKR